AASNESRIGSGAVGQERCGKRYQQSSRQRGCELAAGHGEYSDTAIGQRIELTAVERDGSRTGAGDGHGGHDDTASRQLSLSSADCGETCVLLPEGEGV